MNARRIESPSSINTLRQCPRKYYYQYIEQLPTTTSIHLIRGSVIHQVLEDFFDIELEENNSDIKLLHLRLLSLLQRHWKTSQQDFNTLDLQTHELQGYFDESVIMVQNWFNRFKKKLQRRIQQSQETLPIAFHTLKPRREAEYKSETMSLRGFVDAIYELDDKVLVLDYKTSNKSVITPEYRLQLSLYALLYEEVHQKKPDLVGIDFLRSTEQYIQVDDSLIQEAKFCIEQHHAQTSSNDIETYSKKPSPLCKWRTGQCDYYDICFNGKTTHTYKEEHAQKKQS